MSDNRDNIVQCLHPTTGLFNPNDCEDDYFFSGQGEKERRLQEYYWRYLIARWGYAVSLHSWELTNEGPPYHDLHNDNSDHLAEYFQTNDPHQHLTTTSYWHSFNDDYYNSSATDTPYADVHAYNSTGWLENKAYERDAALYHLDYSAATREMLDSSRQMPIVRGEAGLDLVGGNTQDEIAGLRQDTNGIWLHNYTWALLDSNAMYELYWWTENIWNNNLHFQYRNFRDFMDGIPISNGHYQDLKATVSLPDKVRVIGQKDLVNEQAHLWIQNRRHTWCAVIGGANNCPAWDNSRLPGTVAITGFSSNQTYAVEWWYFNNQSQLTKPGPVFLPSDSQGAIILDLNELPTNVVDAAVKIYISDVLPEPSIGDLNGDGRIDLQDLLIVANSFGKNSGTADYDARADINESGGDIDIFDLIKQAVYLWNS